MSNQYKSERICDCGYTTISRVNWHTHKKRHCKLRTNIDQQLEAKDQHYQKEIEVKDNQINELKEHYQKELAAKNEQIKEKDVQIKELIQVAKSQVVKNKSPSAKNRRTKLPEPKRRKTAASQDWKCANPDGNCTLKGELQEYDVDHIIPLMKGGADERSNMQALCPACHRRKTENDVHTMNSHNSSL